MTPHVIVNLHNFFKTFPYISSWPHLSQVSFDLTVTYGLDNGQDYQKLQVTKIRLGIKKVTTRRAIQKHDSCQDVLFSDDLRK